MTQRIIDSWTGRLRACERLDFQESPVYGQQLLLSWSITQGQGGPFLALGAHGQLTDSMGGPGTPGRGEETAKAFSPGH